MGGAVIDHHYRRPDLRFWRPEPGHDATRWQYRTWTDGQWVCFLLSAEKVSRDDSRLWLNSL